jgi:hypothetical protein
MREHMEQFLEKLTESTPKIIAASGKNRRTLTALGILAVCFIAVLYFRSSPSVSQIVGNDSVVMGNVPPTARVGDRSVVIGATDANGNTILTRPMTVGHNAHGGPNSIVIGADAGGGIP